jgi:N-acetylmuramoyl-L-alanine amidase
LRTIARAVVAVSALLALANCAAVPEPGLPSRASATQPAVELAAARMSGEAVACLAEAVYFEARGTGAEGRRAVAHVVVNRARDPRFPSSVCGVVGEGCQFSYRCDGHAENYAEPASRRRAIETARSVLAGAPDITGGALFFHAARVSPGWFATRARVGQFGGNVFYR